MIVSNIPAVGSALLRAPFPLRLRGYAPAVSSLS